MSTSEHLYHEACSLIPGGVNSPVRAWNSVGGTPFFVQSAKGCDLVDEDGNRYIDYVCSWGPLILGHAHPNVVEAVREAALSGMTYGAPTAKEVTLARMIVEMVPSVEKVRLVNSGTEATLSAIRLARGFTRREKIVKIIGGYHGHHDALLASAGSGVATLAIPSTPGVPESVVKDTVLVPYNDQAAMQSAFDQHGNDIAAIIIEPVAGNMGVVPPRPGYLEFLRVLTKQHDALLIFDEVMTGFRVARGGAQERYGVTPDITTLGKIVGGGMPMGAYGGRTDIMDMIAPSGPVYQAGTLSGNPIATTCGITTLGMLQSGEVHRILEERAAYLEEKLAQAASEAGVPIVINRVGTMMTVFFSDKPVVDFETATACDMERFASFWRAMLTRGIYLPPSAYEGWFLSTAHTNIELDRTIRAAQEAFKEVA